eukprot:jgi/Mesen1/3956/ME000209S02967
MPHFFASSPIRDASFDNSEIRLDPRFIAPAIDSTSSAIPSARPAVGVGGSSPSTSSARPDPVNTTSAIDEKSDKPLERLGMRASAGGLPMFERSNVDGQGEASDSARTGSRGGKIDHVEDISQGVAAGLGLGECVESGSGATVLRELELREKAVSAAAAAFLSAIITNPLDVAKTRLQAQAAGMPYMNDPVWEIFPKNLQFVRTDKMYGQVHGGTTSGSLGMADGSVGGGKYRSTWDVMMKITRQEGVGRLWRGTNAGLALAIPTVGIYLPVYDILREALETGPNGERTRWAPYAPLLAGSLSRSLACVICSPLELARTRMQAQKQMGSIPSAGIFRTLADMLYDPTSRRPALRRAGLLWTGVGAQLARDVPFSAICWATLEPIRRSALETVGPEAGVRQLVAANFGAGVLAGTLAAAITCPLDVVKTRRQIEADPHRRKTMNTVRTLQEIWREAGFKGLFTGVGPRVGRAGPSVGIVVSLYEVVKHFLQRSKSTQLCS